MSEIKNGGLDQYGAKTFEQQKFGTAGVEGLTEARWEHQRAGQRRTRVAFIHGLSPT